MGFSAEPQNVKSYQTECIRCDMSSLAEFMLCSCSGLLVVFFQNAKMRVPSTILLKESVRTKREGISITSPVTQQTMPRNTIARPAKGIITSYLAGFIAKIIKNTPIMVHIADVRRATYTNMGESGRDSTPKCLAMDSHDDSGRKNITHTNTRHAIPAIHKQLFNPNICISFQKESL
jgi:hypothetical protein